jgi:hypothetical protein
MLAQPNLDMCVYLEILSDSHRKPITLMYHMGLKLWLSFWSASRSLLAHWIVYESSICKSLSWTMC